MNGTEGEAAMSVGVQLYGAKGEAIGTQKLSRAPAVGEFVVCENDQGVDVYYRVTGVLHVGEQLARVKVIEDASIAPLGGA